MFTIFGIAAPIVALGVRYLPSIVEDVKKDFKDEFGSSSKPSN